MRAIVLEKFGGLDSLVYKDIPEPEPKAGHVVIQIKAFGINHAEVHMRQGEWAEAAPVSGIECVGIVKSCPRSGGLPQFRTPLSARGQVARPSAPSFISRTVAHRGPTDDARDTRPQADILLIHRVIHRR